MSATPLFRTEGDLDASVRQLFEVLARRRVLLTEIGEFRIALELVDRDRVCKVAQQLSRINLTHGLFAQPARLLGVNELRLGCSQRRSKKHVLRLHCRHQCVVDLTITNAADEAVNTRINQLFRIAEAEDLSHHLQITLMGFIDDRHIDIFAESWPFAVSIVHPDFYRRRLYRWPDRQPPSWLQFAFAT